MRLGTLSEYFALMTKGEKQVEEYYGNLNNGNGIAEI